ncbi:MAG: ankyrin repeat domain-containing protein [Wolbachia endosymbiont of Tyrophagus putrescentiae]|nr:ankyrin repeat domain-containing protein [Wolbachia endosymbiont of Tyrophagus putrescentiae]
MNENKITKQDLVKLYDYINEITANNYLMNIEEIQKVILRDNYGKVGMHPDLINRFIVQGWNTCSDDGVSFLTIAAENKNKEDVSFLLGFMDENLVLNYIRTLPASYNNDEAGCLLLIFKFLAKKANRINERDEYGKALLHYAVQLNNEACFKYLMKHGADLEEETADGENILHLISDHEFLKTAMDFLIGNNQLDALINGQNRNGETPLHIAARSGNKECFALLKEQGAQIETVSGRNVLHYAAESGNVELLRYILSDNKILTNKEIKEIDEQGNNLLHYAVKSCNPKCLDFIKSNPVLTSVIFKKNKYDETPLHYIAKVTNKEKKEYRDTLELLVNKWIVSPINEITCINKEGCTALHLAAQYGNVEFIETLATSKQYKKRGVIIKEAINFPNREYYTPLHLATINGHPECVRQLLKYGAKLNNINNITVVHLAAIFGQYECLKSFLEKLPEKINEQDSKGNSALHFAISLEGKGSNTTIESVTQCVELLIEKGASINQVNYTGNTPLHLAARLGYEELMKFLLVTIRKNTTCNFLQEILSKNKNGETIFHFAARGGNTDCLQYLFSLVEEVNRKKEKEITKEILTQYNFQLETLLHLAILSGNVKCISYLREKTQEVNIKSTLPKPNKLQQNALHLAVLSKKIECVNYIIDIIEASDDFIDMANYFHHRDIEGYSIFHRAACLDESIFFTLHKRLSDIINKNINSIDPFSWLWKAKQALFSKDKNDGLLPLHIAAASLNFETVKYIVNTLRESEHNFIQTASNNGNTALHYIILGIPDNEDVSNTRKKNQHLLPEVLKFLLYEESSQGKKVPNLNLRYDIKNNKGCTPIDCAISGNDQSILTIFFNVLTNKQQLLDRRFNILTKKYQNSCIKILNINTILITVSSIIITLAGRYNENKWTSIAECLSVFGSMCVIVLTLLSSFHLGGNEKKLKKELKQCQTEREKIGERINVIVSSDTVDWITQEILELSAKFQYLLERLTESNQQSRKPCEVMKDAGSTLSISTESQQTLTVPSICVSSPIRQTKHNSCTSVPLSFYRRLSSTSFTIEKALQDKSL